MADYRTGRPGRNSVRDEAVSNPQCMLLHDSISVTAPDRNPLLGHLLRLLLAVTGIVGALWGFAGFFEITIPVGLLTVVTLAAAIVTRILFRSTRRGLIFLLGEGVLIALFCLKMRNELTCGVLTLFRTMAEHILQKPVSTPILTSDPLRMTVQQCENLVFFVTACVLVLVVEFSENSRICFLLRFLVTFMFLETGLYFGLETHTPAVFMLIVFWIGSVIIGMLHEPLRKRPQRKPKKLRRVLHLPCTGRSYVTDGQLLLLIAAAAASLMGTWFIAHRYTRTEAMNEKREQVLKTMSSITIKDVTGIFENLPFDFGPNVISDEIDLQRTSSLDFDGKTMLVIESDDALIRDDYYLRGVARNDYTGRGWGIRNSDYRPIRKLLEKLSADNRMPQSVFHSDHTDEMLTDSGKIPVVGWKIRATATEAVNYVPYQALCESGARFIYDNETELESRQKYSYWLLSHPRANIQADAPSLDFAPELSANENVREYEEFVRKEYLRVPDTPAMEHLRSDFMPNAEPFDADSPLPYGKEDAKTPLRVQLNRIRSYIWAHADYDVNPGAYPEDEDFIEHFLYTAHSGFCAHYASAGVLLCRMCGIPARYVQGYVVTRADILDAVNRKRSGESQLKIEVPDMRAHAWAEIYVDGYGWLPCEFTEGITESWHSTPDSPVSTASTAATTSGSTAATSHTTLTTTGSTTAGSRTGTSAEPGAAGFRIPRWVWVLLIVIPVIAGIILLWRRHHFNVCDRRAKAMRQSNPTRAGNYAYGFLADLLHMQGIDPGNRQHSDFAELAEAHCQLLEEGALTEAIRIQQEAVFSRSGITSEQADYVRETAEQLAEKYYAGCGRLRQFALRWMRHIVR